jgi:hypothetical protein
VLFALQDSGGSRSDSEGSDSDNDSEGGRRELRSRSDSEEGRGTIRSKLAGTKHKSDTMLQNEETKKSGGSSAEGSGTGAADKPLPVVITPSQLQALQLSGASLVFKPGKRWGPPYDGGLRPKECTSVYKLPKGWTLHF